MIVGFETSTVSFYHCFYSRNSEIKSNHPKCGKFKFLYFYHEFLYQSKTMQWLDDALQKKATRLESELRDEGTKHAKRIQATVF